jgi:sugar phosphate isomerase/epimerase
MDTGHLLIDNRSPLEHYKKHRGRIREIHLHGLDNEKAKLDGRLPDHRPLNADDPWLKELLPELKQFAGIINIEVFSWEETEKSLEVLI